MKFKPMTEEDQRRVYDEGVLVLKKIVCPLTYYPPIVRTKLRHYFTADTYPKGYYR